MSVQPNVPAIAMEEVLPLAVSSALAQASHAFHTFGVKTSGRYSHLIQVSDLRNALLV